MLNFEEFQQHVIDNLPKALPEELANARILANEVKKNNGLLLHGITLTPEGCNIAPNIYLDAYFNKYQDGANLDAIMGQIAACVVKHVKTPEEFGNIAEDYLNFDFVKDRVVMVAVNAERNAGLLKEVPYQAREDLALIYKVMLVNNADGFSSITVTNEHMEMWGVTASQLHELAMVNTKEILPISITSMQEVMREMFSVDGMPDDLANALFDEMPLNQQMFIITNEARIQGAATMFYEDALSGLADQMGTDLYILPSSVHELIAVSTDMGTPENLAEMVKEVNGTQVALEEQLSDHVYKYDAASKQITLADTTVEELKIAAGAENMEQAPEVSRSRGNHR